MPASCSSKCCAPARHKEITDERRRAPPRSSPSSRTSPSAARCAHNLKGIDVDIPHNALTVVGSVSGSGKSSLAFDTVYAEGQRRYVESLSAYARQFLERIEKPDVEFMDGLAPAIAIKQKNQTRNPRSTVATATEIYDYLRLLYARCGTVTCLHCGGTVRRDSVDEIVTRVLAQPEGTRVYALFPIQRRDIKLEPMQGPAMIVPEAVEPEPKPKRVAKKSAKSKKETAPAFDITDALKERLAELRRRGYNRLWQADADPNSQGRIVEFSTPESLLELDFAAAARARTKPHARSSSSPTASPSRLDIRSRLVDAIETGYRESGEIQFRTLPREDSETPHTPPLLLRLRSAPPATAPTASPNRASSASTIRTAPARAARASATPSTSTPTSSSPIARNLSTPAPSIRGRNRSTARPGTPR